MRDKLAIKALTTLQGTPITDVEGRLRGRLKDIAVGTGADAGRVAGLVLKTRNGLEVVPAKELRWTPSGALELRPEATLRELKGDENFILLRQDLLDRQIIDVHGRKVVRVNDVDLQWFTTGNVEDLRVSEVETGLRGALRRLLAGTMPKRTIEALVRKIPARVIPWQFVDMIEVDPARRVKLRIEHERLAQLHPSDIADILENLAPAEREAVLTTLDEEVAAEALEEVDPRLQKSLVEALDSETAAGIVEEMDPSAAADLLAELPDERSEAILEEMDPEERQEVEELLEFREDSAAGRMTTEYIAVAHTATVGDAIQALREFDGDPETVTEIYLIEENDTLKGVVPLARLVLARPETRLSVLTEPHFISVQGDAHQNEVAELFDKYNLRALPVVNGAGKLVGAIEADHVIAFLRGSH
ncbi:magnesium transporter MgtE N-terminal domain-containing protein [Paracidobacterium acidisoli]|uniref:Magnesium transporter n=1 Tax=Paracidobacterium acidisoli TaxID=2303751 RepID=A0A372IRI5_9BACT|nr:CBS domain-containing protein [Paracidobacterium acidisoli]MBT9330382.1 CBS domain-containing protein [Paracidobacterium acidisoli]